MTGEIELAIEQTPATTREVKPSDDNFFIKDGMKLVPRACLEISNNCPSEYKTIIGICVERGWLKPVAFVRDTEEFWERLNGE